MACVDILHTNAGNALFYNLDAAVGMGAPNKGSDVLLVQYLLKEGCKAPFLAEVQEGAGYTQQSMDITGVWDNYWNGYLGNYLLTLKNRGKHVVYQPRANHRVDPVVGGQPRGPIHHMQYTILYLNLGYQSLRPKDFPRMAEVGDCPGELRPLLKPIFIY